MTRRVQHYLIQVDHPTAVPIGMMVQICPLNDTVCGFVYMVDQEEKRAHIILWEPMELEFNHRMEFVAEETPNVNDLFGEAIRLAPAWVLGMWNRNGIRWV